MLTEITGGVLVHQSTCLQSNAVVVCGSTDALVVDPGLTRDEIACLAADIRRLGLTVAAGFSTHPDWDHVLWHPALGEAPRWGTSRCAAEVRGQLSEPDWREQMRPWLPPEIADDVPMELLGLITPVPDGEAYVPWDGPAVRMIEHRAHAPGHAALVVEDAGVLIAGDMVSDVLVPMPDLFGSSIDPIGDYLESLALFSQLVREITFTVPGHGSIATQDETVDRISLDRAYIGALREDLDVDDPRLGHRAAPGWEWVTALSTNQRARLRAQD